MLLNIFTTETVLCSEVTSEPTNKDNLYYLLAASAASVFCVCGVLLKYKANVSRFNLCFDISLMN